MLNPMGEKMEPAPPFKWFSPSSQPRHTIAGLWGRGGRPKHTPASLGLLGVLQLVARKNLTALEFVPPLYGEKSLQVLLRISSSVYTRGSQVRSFSEPSARKFQQIVNLF